MMHPRPKQLGIAAAALLLILSSCTELHLKELDIRWRKPFFIPETGQKSGDAGD